MSTNTPALFDRGETLYGPTATIDTTTPDYGGSVNLEGISATFDYIDPSNPTRKTGRKQHAICVRNTSGITLMRRLAVTWSTTAGERGKRVKGYSCVTAAEIAGYVDDRLGTGGVRNGDMFWLIVKGPVLALTPLAGDATNVVSAGDILFAATAAASTAVTTGATTADEAGGFTIDDGTFSQTETTNGVLRNTLRNSFAVALSAATTANTKTSLLIDLYVPRSPGL